MNAAEVKSRNRRLGRALLLSLAVLYIIVVVGVIVLN